jgi:hypothetical protein
MKTSALLLALFATPSLSQTASAAPAWDGRVFFSAQERSALERHAYQDKAAAPPLPVPLFQRRRFDGALWRDGRLIVIWLDRDAAAPDTVPAIHLDRGTVAVRAEPLLPGQTVDREQKTED